MFLILKMLTYPLLIPTGPNHVKSSLLGSTSDSNINKYSTINKIPLIALNFSEGTDRKTHSPPTSETTIIAPKVKTHNVTKKVTQVGQKIHHCNDKIYSHTGDRLTGMIKLSSFLLTLVCTHSYDMNNASIFQLQPCGNL